MSTKKRRPINFILLRRQIPPARVLETCGISYTRGSDCIVRAKCPFHLHTSRRPRCWRANNEVWYCDRDRKAGDAVALYAYLTGMTVLDAAYALCDKFHIEIPYL